MTSAAVDDVRPWSPVWGLWLGTAAALAYLPVTLAIRNAVNVPIPNPTPGYIRAHPAEVATSYWVTWGVSLLVLVLPGLVLAFTRKGRRVAIVYILTAGTVGIVLCIGLIGFELGGFAPT